MILESLVPVDGALPGAVLTEVTALYAANHAFFELSGEFREPDAGAGGEPEAGPGGAPGPVITVERVAAALADELAQPGSAVHLARSAGRLVGLVATLDHHPAGADPDPWIGLLLVDTAAQRQGHGRRLAALVEDRYRAAGRAGLRLAVLDANPAALAFWTALGYTPVRRGADLAMGRACTVLRKPLTGG